jgi:hypothetical protein
MELQIEPTPASEHLVKIYSSLPEATLAQEEARLRAAYSEIGGKIMAISQIREEKQDEYPVSA